MTTSRTAGTLRHRQQKPSSVQPATTSAASTTRELPELLKLAWPMMLTQLFIMLTGFLDTAMSGHYGTTDLSGVGMAGNVLWPLFMLLSGLTLALTPIVAQLRGAGDTGGAGERVRQGLWLALFAGIALIVAIISAAPALLWAGVEAPVVDIADRYLRAVAWGVPAIVLYVALRNVCDGLGHTRPAMYIAGSILPLNALLNYAFIYGHFGAPELGGEGCGWATAIVFWVQLALMTLVIKRPFFRAAQVFERFDPPRLGGLLRILRIGLPIGLASFVGMALFAVIGILIARLGEQPFAGHSIAGNLNWMTYVIPMGLGAAAGIRVGFFVGAGDLPGARHAAATAWWCAFGYALVVSVLLVLFRHLLVSVYTTDPAVADIAATLLLFIAVYQIVDDSQAAALGALRGYKDTTVPMINELLGYWLIALPLGHALALGYGPWAPLGVYGYWAGLTVGLFLVAVANALRLWRTANHPERIARLALH